MKHVKTKKVVQINNKPREFLHLDIQHHAEIQLDFPGPHQF